VGIPAGHGYGPWPLAIDARHGRLYSFNAGRSSPDDGYSISIIDLKTNQVTGLIRLPGPIEHKFASTPLDILVDPYRPRLYALWGNRSDRSPFTSLAVIDLDTLTILDTLHDVLAVVPGPDRLYLAGPTRLWTVDPQSLQEQDSLDLSSSISTPQSLLLLNPTVNRLFLGQNHNELAVFEATTLKLLNTYTNSAQLLQAAVDEANGWVYVVGYDGAQIELRVLTSDGSRNQSGPVADL
jgi:DNA-binding beta-propeller fold protein YncE